MINGDEYAEADGLVYGGGLDDFDGVCLISKTSDLDEHFDSHDFETNMAAKLK